MFLVSAARTVQTVAARSTAERTKTLRAIRIVISFRCLSSSTTRLPETSRRAKVDSRGLSEPEIKTRRPPAARGSLLLPFAGIVSLLVLWDVAIRFGQVPLLPGPLAVARAIG